MGTVTIGNVVDGINDGWTGPGAGSGRSELTIICKRVFAELRSCFDNAVVGILEQLFFRHHVSDGIAGPLLNFDHRFPQVVLTHWGDKPGLILRLRDLAAGAEGAVGRSSGAALPEEVVVDRAAGVIGAADHNTAAAVDIHHGVLAGFADRVEHATNLESARPGAGDRRVDVIGETRVFTRRVVSRIDEMDIRTSAAEVDHTLSRRTILVVHVGIVNVETRGRHIGRRGGRADAVPLSRSGLLIHPLAFAQQIVVTPGDWRGGLALRGVVLDFSGVRIDDFLRLRRNLVDSQSSAGHHHRQSQNRNKQRQKLLCHSKTPFDSHKTRSNENSDRPA